MNAIKLGVVALLGLSITAGSYALGDSADEKAKQKKAYEQVDKRLIDTNKACGTKILATIHFDTFKPHYDKDHREFTAGAHCATAANELRVLCGKDEAFVEAIRKKVARLNCQYSDTEFVEIHEGVMSVGYNYNSSQLGDKLAKGMKEKL